MTDHQSKYWASQLVLQRPAGTLDNLSRSISSARVQLNPHQIDAALFAFRSPLSKGVLLADEVGLGKTIEAGIIILQKWAERKRKILLILPASLRNQWQMELIEKFYLDSKVLESKVWKELKSDGHVNPFEAISKKKIVICSYDFVHKNKEYVKVIDWDLVVIDEAHRLRNVYKPGNKVSQSIREAIGERPKVLLTATPLQNSLMELYGLVSFIDSTVFGDEKSFLEQYGSKKKIDGFNNREIMGNAMRSFPETEDYVEPIIEIFDTLRKRLDPFCKRTLRKQVLEYVKFTQRKSILNEYAPTATEMQLYEGVSSYLQREQLAAFPNSQRALMTLVVRKLLASSSFAIAQTLQKLIDRLSAQVQANENDLAEDFEGLDELSDEWNSDEKSQKLSQNQEDTNKNEDDDHKKKNMISPEALKAELAELEHFLKLANSIKSNTKGQELIKALQGAFLQTENNKAARKAVIFTESRRTQEYLFGLLNENGYEGQAVMMNGSNTDPYSAEIYKQWKERHKGTDRVSGQKAIDMKAAIVEEFRERATLLIATEAAAEGINLQFCSLVVNYDLPWNPQRVEQRIGRCHRYGQKHDVVVVNFLNTENAADKRVFELLKEKFNLFEGIFGSSDGILGAIESGVDIEKRIADVYQKCRTHEEIDKAFDDLQKEMENEVSNTFAKAQRTLLENFDEVVANCLQTRDQDTKRTLGERQKWLLNLTKHELADRATFDTEQPRFAYQSKYHFAGSYHFRWEATEQTNDSFYMQEHPLALQLITRALERKTPVETLRFDYAASGVNKTALEAYRGKSGFLRVYRLSYDGFDHEEHLIPLAFTDSGEPFPDCPLVNDLLNLHATQAPFSGTVDDAKFEQLLLKEREAVDGDVEGRAGVTFDEYVERIYVMSEDLETGLRIDLGRLVKTKNDLSRKASKSKKMEEKLVLQKQIREAAMAYNKKESELIAERKRIEDQRDEMISNAEKTLNNSKQTTEVLFTARWELI